MSAKSDSKSDVVVKLPISSLRDFSCHPYKVRDDKSMRETAESVKTFGVLVPIIVRPCDAGGYEIISGHRRKRACELADIDTMPAIVRELDDDAATIVMVDSNLQRENVLPSERAQAHIRTSREILAENSSDSSTQIQLYIRLTSMDSEQATPSLSQAQRLKQFSQRGELTAEVRRAIISKGKTPEIAASPADGGDHHQAAGTVAKAQKARGRTLIEYKRPNRTVHELPGFLFGGKSYVPVQI